MKKRAPTVFPKGFLLGRRGSAVSNNLDLESIMELVDGCLGCIWVKNWFEVEHLTEAAGNISKLFKGFYNECDGVTSFGPPIGSWLHNEISAERYSFESSLFIQRLREELFPDGRDPIHALLKALGDCWKAGAIPFSIEGKDVTPGIIRSLKAGTCLYPHVDHSFEKDLSSVCRRARLTANVYFNSLDSISGGRLELWDREFGEEDFNNLSGENFSLSRRLLGLPALTIAPSKGDLIIFNAERIHAVSYVNKGYRITASSFIGISDELEPAVFFG